MQFFVTIDPKTDAITHPGFEFVFSDHAEADATTEAITYAFMEYDHYDSIYMHDSVNPRNHYVGANSSTKLSWPEPDDE